MRVSATAAIVLSIVAFSLSCERIPGEPNRGRVSRLVFESGFLGTLLIANVDGTGVRTVLPYYAGAGAWSPGLDRIAFCNDQGIGVTDTLGNAAVLGGTEGGCWPQYSPDGKWIYYSHGDQRQIRRIHPDGTGAETLFPGEYATPSPDGGRVAFASPGGNYGPLVIGDIGTRTVVALPGATGTTPRWSPDGQSIAYVDFDGGGVHVVRTDGTVVRVFAGGYDGGLGWSPDSRYIVASQGPWTGPRPGFEHGTRLVRLEVSSGTVLSLQVTGVYPNWAP